MPLDRRTLLRIAAPAVALPMAASVPQLAQARLVSRDEIMAAFRFYDHMELRAEDFNLRYQVLIEMLFETNPETLRAKLQQLHDLRDKGRVLVDADTGQTAPYDPAMYDEQGQLKFDATADSYYGRFRPDLPSYEKLMQGSVPKLTQGSVVPSVKPRWRIRLAAWLLGWRA